MSVTVFLEEISTLFIRLDTEDPPLPMRMGINPLDEGLNKTKKVKGRVNSCSLFLSPDTYLLLPYVFGVPGSRFGSSDLELKSAASLF